MPGKSSPRVTIADVAKLAGVSISTVSRVINGSQLVNQKTAKTVHEAISTLGYAPESAARNLASRRTNTLGVLLPTIGSYFFGQVVAGIEDIAYQAGYDLLIATPHLPTGRQTYDNTLGPHNTDGLLLVNVPFSESILMLCQEGFPVVSLYRSAPEPMGIPTVTVENKNGAFKLIDHLIEVHGYREIGFLRGPEGNEDSPWRERGYREALQKHGIPLCEEWIGRGEFNAQDGRTAILEWASRGHLPRAIFAGDDDAALGAMLTLSEMQKSIPEDIAVVGFDDSYLASFLVPPLTTVHAPTEQVGRVAAQQLIQLIHSGEADPLVLLPTELVIRRSCGCSEVIERQSLQASTFTGETNVYQNAT